MPRLSVWLIRLALIYFGVGLTVGGLLLFNKGVLLDARLWRLWPIHVELTLIGWMMQLVMGVAYWILPRFTGMRRYGRRIWLGWIALVLLNAGVLAASIGQGIGHLPVLVLVGRFCQLLAASAFALYIWPRVKPLGVGDA